MAIIISTGASSFVSPAGPAGNLGLNLIVANIGKVHTISNPLLIADPSVVQPYHDRQVRGLSPEGTMAINGRVSCLVVCP